jgi:beta-lactamase regulating signal transducer with metallopeptidase domain
LQLVIAVAAVAAAALGRLRLPASRALWLGRSLVLAALVAPLIAAALDLSAPFAAPAQVWSEIDTRGGAVLTVAPAATSAPDGGALDATPAAMAVVAAIMALGVVIAAARTGAAWWRLRRIVADAALVHRFGRVEVRVAAGAPCPFAVWLPGTAAVVLDERTYADPVDRLIAVRHELQHHRQRDPQLALAFAAVRALCWPNPLVHLAGRWLGELEELACDMALVSRGRVSAHGYGSSLVRAARRASRPTIPAVAAGLSPAASRSLLKRRIEMLTRMTTTPRTRWATLIATTTAATLALAVTAWAADNLVADLRVDPDRVAAAAGRASTPQFEVPFNDAVVAAIQKFAGRERGRLFIRRGLDAMEAHTDLVYGALERYGMPHQLAVIPLIESGYANLPADPGESAAPPGPMGAGLWMFIPSTARTYGMAVGDGVDQRLDPEIETEAAMALLSDLYAEFGDWHLALAGYNQGAKHVREAIAEHGTRDAFELMEAGALNDYVALMMAGVIILEDPALVGHEP